MRGRGVASPDPFVVNESLVPNLVWKSTAGVALRSQSFNPAQKTLVLIAAGQSNFTSIIPTAYTLTNDSKVDQFNLSDGACYAVTSPMLSATQYAIGGFGPGCLIPRIADKFIDAAVFDRVVLLNVAIGGTNVADWATGTLASRCPVAMQRLISRGFVPGATGLTFGFLWGQGEADGAAGTTQAAYTAALNAVLSNLTGAGFVGRSFVCQMTYAYGATSSTIRAAQAGIVNGTTIFSGGDVDTYTSSYRQADNIHLSDTGASVAATVIYNAMHASGSPF